MAWRVLQTGADGKPTRFAMIRPDNWHAHGRAGRKMRWTLGEIACVYGRATLMSNNGLEGPNPIVTVQNFLDYRRAAIETLMSQGYSAEVAESFAHVTIYLNPLLTEDDIRTAIEQGCIGFKFYPKNPKHATTGANTDYSVSSLTFLRDQIEWIAKYGGFLLVHGEDATPGERLMHLEEKFIERQLGPVVERYGDELNVVAEHATTKAMVDFVLRAPASVSATVTCMHLRYILDSLFEGGLRARRWCMPIYKHPEDMQALIEAVTAWDNTKFAAGDDDATHPEHGEKGKAKYADCGCAGAHPGRYSVPAYIETFEKAGALDQRVENFLSKIGAGLRNLPLNQDTIVLERIPYEVPNNREYGHGETTAYVFGGETFSWKIVEGEGAR